MACLSRAALSVRLVYPTVRRARVAGQGLCFRACGGRAIWIAAVLPTCARWEGMRRLDLRGIEMAPVYTS